MRKTPDTEIINQLQYGDHSEVNSVLAYLHQRLYRQVANFISRHYGTSDDTEDIFQDGLLAIYKLAKNDALKKDTNVEAYFFTICKNLWFQQLRKKKDTIALEDIPTEIAVPEITLFSMIKQEEQMEVKKMMDQIGEDCRKVMILYYYKKVRMKEIAERMGYSSEQVAKNRKSGCLKKLKTLMLSSSIFKNRMK